MDRKKNKIINFLITSITNYDYIIQADLSIKFIVRREVEGIYLCKCSFAQRCLKVE